MSPTTMSRSTTVVDNSRDGPAANGSATFAFGGGGGSSGGDRKGKRSLPHIDDITSVSIDLDSYTPIDTVLNTAESFLRQAESAKTFGRPDFALRDFIKATTIVVDVIKKNKGWVSLQRDNKTQLDRYRRILRQVNASHDIFEGIKADIKADNARTGVQPTVRQPRATNPAPSQEHREDKSRIATESPSGDRASVDSATWRRHLASPAAKTKPAVHPKPQALHGNAIKPASRGQPPASRAVQDLAQRFANLRTTAASPSQDPRIRTQPIAAPRPVDGRDDASDSRRASFVADNVLPDLPKMPDAIYSPARGTVSSEAAELPSSTPHGIFSRTNSTASFSNGSTAIKSTPPDDYFTPFHSSGTTAQPPKRTKLTIPEGDTISAQDLVEFMRWGSKDISILLIDIRSREEFDEGHILSQATICVESEVLTRENISASEIADSMVLAPSSEQLHFERRHGFDLVVFYDQDSPGISWRTDTSSERAITGLYNALSHYDFAKEDATKRPKLLEGGLDAWANLMGKVSLQSSTTAMGTRPRPGASSVGKSPIFRPKPRQKYVTRPIQDADEARRWEETLNHIESFSPVRTTGDFLRRFPSVSAIQESMAAPAARPSRPEPGLSGHGPPRAEDLFSSWPAPPQRPAPTVPRPSYSGLAETDNRDELMRVLKTSPREERKDRKLVGLVNPGNWCYANSSLQSMFGTPGFADDLSSGDWQERYKVPMKLDEKIQPPQLLAKMLANLFYWMDKGKFEVMEARTLMQYLHHIHRSNMNGTKKPDDHIFGGQAQQDAQEYFSFIIDQLHDETNRYRDQPPQLTASKDNDPGSLLHNSIDYWNAYATRNDSIVDRYWRGLLANSSVCPRCGDKSIAFQVSDLTTLGIPDQNRDLESMLAEYTALETPEGFNCKKCGLVDRGRKLNFARMPDRFAVAFQRFQHSSGASKIGHRVSFPIQDLDLEPYWIGPNDREVTSDGAAATVAKEDRHFRGPFLYDCYAVICHTGKTLGSGHYIAYTNDESSADPTDWIRFNDSIVSRVKVGTKERGDELETMYKSGSQQAYMVFYKRKGT